MEDLNSRIGPEKPFFVRENTPRDIDESSCSLTFRNQEVVKGVSSRTKSKEKSRRFCAFKNCLTPNNF